MLWRIAGALGALALSLMGVASGCYWWTAFCVDASGRSYCLNGRGWEMNGLVLLHFVLAGLLGWAAFRRRDSSDSR